MTALAHQQSPQLEAHEAYTRSITAEVKDLEHFTEDQYFHYQRRLGIGGSDVGAILGFNPYKTALDIFNEKRGYTPPQDLSDNDAVHFGHVLEDVVAREYMRRTGLKVQRRNNPFTAPERPWLIANVDRVVVGQRKVLECKTAGSFAQGWGDTGTDEVPESYLCQCAHYMNVLGYAEADLAVLTGGQQFGIYTIHRSPELIEHIENILTDFWFNNVIADVPPDPVNLKDLASRYPRDNGEQLTASDYMLEEISELKRLKQEKKDLEELVKTAEIEIKKAMGENTTLVDADGNKLCSWKAQSSNRFDSTRFRKEHPDLADNYIKTSESRVFRVA